MIKKTGNYLIIFLLYTLIQVILPDTVTAIDAKKDVLNNGLTVLSSERHNLPIVMLTLLIEASKVNEPTEKAGLSNLTAKMLTEGTKKMTSREISDEIEFMGAQLGVSANTDYTTISLSILKKYLDRGFEILSDVLLNPTFPENELNHKKELIKGSLRQSEESPSFLARRAFIKEVFGAHPYGRLSEGSIETIDLITRKDLKDFHREYFVPARSILAVTGDISHADLISLINKHLNKWKNNRTKKDRAEYVSKPPVKKLVKIDRDLTQASIIFGHKGIKRDNPYYYKVSVMNYILGGGGFASRLMDKIRDDMGLAYDIHSSFNSNKYGGAFKITIQTKNETTLTAINEILKQIKKIKKEYVTGEEINDAKAYLTGSFPRRIDTTEEIASFLALTEYYNLGTDYDKNYIDYINSVTIEDVRMAARKYLNEKDYVLVLVGDQGKIDLTDPESN